MKIKFKHTLVKALPILAFAFITADAYAGSPATITSGKSGKESAVAPKEESIYDKIWGIPVLYSNKDNAFIQEWFYSNDGSRWRADVPPGPMGTPGWGDGSMP